MRWKESVGWGIAVLLASTAAGQSSPEDAIPLAAPDLGQPVSPLFEELSPSSTGVRFDNRFDHPEQWTRLATQYFLGTIGTGIAVGDFDGNGLPDIYAVGKDSPNALFLNGGGFRFEDATERAGVAGGDGFGAGTSAVDIDGDGDLDLYVCYVGSPNELYLNDGTGRFREAGEEWGLAISTGSNAPAFADYDRDGDLDLYLQCNYLESAGLAEGLPDRLYRNEGDRFVEVTDAAGISGLGQGHAAIWWDYNEDGWPDLYVANDFGPGDKLYRNNGDGTFTDALDQALVSAPYSSMGADFGDINNDGHIDFLASEMLATTVEKFHRTIGALMFKLRAAPKHESSQYMKNMLSLKIGPEQFTEIAYLSGLHATDWTWAPRLADLDNDGWLDAFFTNGMIRAFHDGDIGYRAQRTRNPMQRMALFKASPRLEERNLAFRNRGDLRFEEVGAAWGLDKLGVHFAAALADFDRDGDLDVVMNGLEPDLTLYRNRSGSGGRMLLRLVGDESNRWGVGAVVTAEKGGLSQTRALQLQRGYLSNDEPLLHFAFPEAGALDRLHIRWPSGRRQELRGIELGRLHVVTEPSAAERAPETDEARPLFRAAAFSLGEAGENREELYQMFPDNLLVPFLETRRGPPVATADLNGDGWPDLVVGGATGQAARVFLNEGGRELRWVENEDFEDDFDSEDQDILVDDFDGDGRPDLWIASGGYELDAGDRYYRDRLYLNRGHGRFERVDSALEGEAEATRRLVRIDLNGDGREDALRFGGARLGRYPKTSGNTAWLATEAGFERAGAEALGLAGLLAEERVLDACVADVDGDGDADLALAIEWGEAVWWENAGDGFRRRRLGGGRSGIWSAVTVGDFNGDGMSDLAFGNVGLNTRLTAEPGAEVTLYAPRAETRRGSFVLGRRYESGFYPLDSIQLHRAHFPQLFDVGRVPVAEYARRTLEELFPAETLAEFDRYVIAESRSGFFLQEAGGGFRFEALPSFGQSGPIRDLLVLDANGDGVDDLVAAHEYLPPALWAEREHPGHASVTLGSRDEAWESLDAFRSGLTTEELPTRLAAAELTGHGGRELVVSESGGRVLIFSPAE